MLKHLKDLKNPVGSVFAKTVNSISRLSPLGIHRNESNIQAQNLEENPSSSQLQPTNITNESDTFEDDYDLSTLFEVQDLQENSFSSQPTNITNERLNDADGQSNSTKKYFIDQIFKRLSAVREGAEAGIRGANEVARENVTKFIQDMKESILGYEDIDKDTQLELNELKNEIDFIITYLDQVFKQANAMIELCNSSNFTDNSLNYGLRLEVMLFEIYYLKNYLLNSLNNSDTNNLECSDIKNNVEKIDDADNKQSFLSSENMDENKQSSTVDKVYLNHISSVVDKAKGAYEQYHILCFGSTKRKKYEVIELKQTKNKFLGDKINQEKNKSLDDEINQDKDVELEKTENELLDNGTNNNYRDVELEKIDGLFDRNLIKNKPDNTEYLNVFKGGLDYLKAVYSACNDLFPHFEKTNLMQIKAYRQLANLLIFSFNEIFFKTLVEKDQRKKAQEEFIQNCTAEQEEVIFNSIVASVSELFVVLNASLDIKECQLLFSEQYSQLDIANIFNSCYDRRTYLEVESEAADENIVCVIGKRLKKVKHEKDNILLCSNHDKPNKRFDASATNKNTQALAQNLLVEKKDLDDHSVEDSAPQSEVDRSQFIKKLCEETSLENPSQQNVKLPPIPNENEDDLSLLNHGDSNGNNEILHKNHEINSINNSEIERFENSQDSSQHNHDDNSNTIEFCSSVSSATNTSQNSIVKSLPTITTITNKKLICLGNQNKDDLIWLNFAIRDVAQLIATLEQERRHGRRFFLLQPLNRFHRKGEKVCFLRTVEKNLNEMNKNLSNTFEEDSKIKTGSVSKKQIAENNQTFLNKFNDFLTFLQNSKQNALIVSGVISHRVKDFANDLLPKVKIVAQRLQGRDQKVIVYLENQLVNEKDQKSFFEYLSYFFHLDHKIKERKIVALQEVLSELTHLNEERISGSIKKETLFGLHTQLSNLLSDPTVVYGHPSRVKTCLRNLLINDIEKQCQEMYPDEWLEYLKDNILKPAKEAIETKLKEKKQNHFSSSLFFCQTKRLKQEKYLLAVISDELQGPSDISKSVEKINTAFIKISQIKSGPAFDIAQKVLQALQAKVAVSDHILNNRLR